MEVSRASRTSVWPGIATVTRLSRGWPLAVIALGVCWLLFFNELRREWQVNPQYGYGYVVPLLGLSLLWKRWQERPAHRSPGVTTPAWIAAGLLFFLLPLRLIFEANPEWRLVYWVHGIVLLGASACLLHHAGGWDWVKWFLPPLAFMLVAIPWPMQFEQAAIQNLMRAVAGCTVGLVGWFGIPAIQHGNLIEVGAGVVGIDEACSGVRSLQSAFMLSLFFGEMFRFATLRRLALLAASLALVMVANVARTTFLTWTAASHGLKQMEAWHDRAGLLVMVIVLPALFALAHFMKAKSAPGALTRRPPGQDRIQLPRGIAVAILLWLGFCQAATAAWYRVHEGNLLPTPRWSVSWPRRMPAFQKTALPANSLAILRCSSSEAAAWRDEEGNDWGAFFLRWDPGQNSAQLAKGHRPDICFPAAGARLADDFGSITVTAHGIEFQFRHQTFQSGARLLHVFYCLWPDRTAANENPSQDDGSQASRLRAVFAGKRNLGQSVLEVVVSGPETADAAVALMKQELPELVRAGGDPSAPFPNRF